MILVFFRGANATGDAGNASPAIFGESETKCLISPKPAKLLPTVTLRKINFTEVVHAGSVGLGPNTKSERERESLEIQQQQLNSVSVAVCHCQQDLLDVVDV